MAVKIPAILALRAEFDAVSPARDRGADGIAGDAAHMAKRSDHNPDDTAGSSTPHSDSDTIPEYHALDIDSTGPWPGATFHAMIMFLIDEFDTMGSKSPVSYVIWDHHIYQAVHGWQKEPYGGTDPHTGHAHFSFKYGSGTSPSNPENYPGPYGLQERYAPMTPEDRKFITDTIAAQIKAALPDIAKAVLMTDNIMPGPSMAASVKDGTNPKWTDAGYQADQSNYARINSGKLDQILALLDPPPPQSMPA